MKKTILFFSFLLIGINSYAASITNPDGSRSYIGKDGNATTITNPDGSKTYIQKDISGYGYRIDNGDGTTSYLNDGPLS